MLLAVKFNVVPAHTGPLLPAVGAAGDAFTVTVVVPADPAHPFIFAITEYTPAPARVIPAMDGFCKAEVKPLGPVQE